MGQRRSRRMKGYTVSYDTTSHISVLCQMTGSAWPKVLPYCLWNVAINLVVQYLHDVQGIDLSISDKGHQFINYFMAFLIVSRVNMTLNRYIAARKQLGLVYNETREIVQQVVALTRDRQDEASKIWRQDVCFRCMIFLRTAMAAVDYNQDGIAPWNVPELDESERKELKTKLEWNLGSSREARTWTSTYRSENENSLRVPSIMAQKLRHEIVNNRHLKKPLHFQQEMFLLKCVQTKMQAWSGLKYFLITPHPFPLVQKTRTFLFAYVFTLPFALLSDFSFWFAHVFVIFILTFGYIGLETVAMELDDPFGNDDNDFDNLGMAYTCFEDIYLSIYDVDGLEWTNRLRERMLNHFKPDEKGSFREEDPLLAGASF